MACEGELRRAHGHAARARDKSSVFICVHPWFPSLLAPQMTVTLREIEEAAQVIKGQVIDTPCLPSHTLSEITGAEVYLKFENHQFTASFKERGALNKLASLTPAQRAKGVIACSAGNHAQGVA